MTPGEVPHIFSRERRSRRDARAAAFTANRPDPARWLVEAMAEDAVERIGFMRLQPRSAMLIGAGAEVVAEALGPDCATVFAGPDAEERPSATGGFDLIVSLGRLDTVNDLPGALLHHRQALAPGGILIASILGAGSLPRLRRIMLSADGERAAPRIHPQVDTRAATMLLERAGFARQVVDGHGMDVRYGSLARLIGDLREQGLTSALARPGPSLGKVALARAEAAFAEAADEDGRVTEHFELLTLTGWAP